MEKQISKPAVDEIQKRIFLARNTPVMLDVDVARLYGLPLQAFLNMAVKETKLPDDFLLRLSENECPANRAIQDSFLYAVSESGMLMMPTLFSDERYVEINIALLRAVAAFRKKYRLRLVKAQGKLN
ncbi:MAG: ORF6N domain-containing protein [Candidatus Omnitrophica bacterium]|nr:ORF6N domain-containing protein [Candidatus Omnitrophota bacterium]